MIRHFIHRIFVLFLRHVFLAVVVVPFLVEQALVVERPERVVEGVLRGGLVCHKRREARLLECSCGHEPLQRCQSVVREEQGGVDGGREAAKEVEGNEAEGQQHGRPLRAGKGAEVDGEAGRQLCCVGINSLPGAFVGYSDALRWVKQSGRGDPPHSVEASTSRMSCSRPLQMADPPQVSIVDPNLHRVPESFANNFVTCALYAVKEAP